jgi:dTDP-4-dehydrorhamnose 3,5-epimerase-like enzyme
MDNKKYVDLVNSEEFPKTIEVPLDTPFVDKRGLIQNLWLGQSGSVTFIESKKGSTRANHIHTNDWHATYVINGKILYSENVPLGDDMLGFEKKDTVFAEGQMFFTKPKVHHTMYFLEDTKMITINNIVKNHENYEKDIVRK